MAGAYCHVCLYEILHKSGAYFKLRCGQSRIKIRSARGSYMKYSTNQRRISNFVVGRTGSEYGLPVAVYMRRQLPSLLQQSPPPRGNRNWPIGPSTVPGRAHCPSGGRHDRVWLRVYDPIFVVSGWTCPFYMKYSANQGVFQASLWAEPDQNTVRPWRLYEALSKG